MNRKERDANLVYDLHHAIDPIILPISRRILKFQWFARARENFDWDLLNDIGIINLLRQDYLRNGSISKTFRLYQSTRLDSRSHRYESLLVLLVVTTVGTVAAGLILDLYKENKQKLAGWLIRLRQEARLFNEEESNADIFKTIIEHKDRLKLAQKFASTSAEEVIKDFDVVLQCFIARQMLDHGSISFLEYLALVERFLADHPRDGDESLWGRYLDFTRTYGQSGDAIDMGKVTLAIQAYTKGTLAQRLEEMGVDLALPKNTDVAAVFDGIPASPGAAAGVSHLLGCDRVTTTHQIILAADASRYGPRDIPSIEESAGVVATNCGITGHIPVLCRGLGKPCAIIAPQEFARIRNGDRLGLSGTTGLVGVGVLVKLPGAM